MYTFHIRWENFCSYVYRKVCCVALAASRGPVCVSVCVCACMVSGLRAKATDERGTAELNGAREAQSK